MNRYENRPVPENNVSTTHPLTEFLWLGSAALLLMVGLVATVWIAGHHLARYVPFAWESQLRFAWPESPVPREESQPVDALLNRLLNADPLPDDITVRLTVVEGDTLNAMAGPGGQMMVYQGLVDALDNEVALAFVLAHEAAHVRHRDVMKSLLSQSVLAIGAALLVGNDSQLMHLAVSATSLGFSRQQELAADRRAMETLWQYYGHLDGAERVFQILQQDSVMGAWLMSHPDSEDRLAQLAAFKAAH